VKVCFKLHMIIFLFSVFLSNLLAAEKPRIAIADLDAISVDRTLARTVSELLRTEFFKTGNFSVMERSQLEKLMEEQKLHVSGLTRDEDIVKIGQLLVVQYFVVGSLTRLGGAYVINIRFIDIEKGRVVAAENIKIKSEEEIVGAVRSIVRKTTNFMPIRGKVVKVRGKEIIVSLGSQDRIKAGTLLKVERLGEVFKDPSTGRILGREVIEIGTLQITKIIDEELSSTHIVESYGNIEVGDIVSVWGDALEEGKEKEEPKKEMLKLPSEKPEPVIPLPSF